MYNVTVAYCQILSVLLCKSCSILLVPLATLQARLHKPHHQDDDDDPGDRPAKAKDARRTHSLSSPSEAQDVNSIALLKSQQTFQQMFQQSF